MKEKKKDERLIQIRLTKHAAHCLEELEESTGISNKTLIVNSSIDLFSEVVSVIKNGGKVIYQFEDGSQERLRVLGI